MKKLVKLLSILAPSFFVKQAYKHLTSPQVKKLREREMITLEKSDSEILEFKGYQIKTYSWGKGNKSILLVHGWEGQAGNFSDLIELLIKEDYKIYSFDAPSHGFSSSGKTSLLEFTELVQLLLQEWNIACIVSHSFGGVATTYALQNIPLHHIDKYCLLTTPDKFSERIDDVSAELGISNKIKMKLIDKLENETNMSVNSLDVSKFVRKISVRKALIIHDKADKVIPIERAKNVCNHWQECSFLEVENTGHFRILRTPEVLQKVITFLR